MKKVLVVILLNISLLSGFIFAQQPTLIDRPIEYGEKVQCPLAAAVVHEPVCARGREGFFGNIKTHFNGSCIARSNNARVLYGGSCKSFLFLWLDHVRYFFVDLFTMGKEY